MVVLASAALIGVGGVLTGLIPKEPIVAVGIDASLADSFTYFTVRCFHIKFHLYISLCLQPRFRFVFFAIDRNLISFCSYHTILILDASNNFDIRSWIKVAG
jgi:hypothetical protein